MKKKTEIKFNSSELIRELCRLIGDKQFKKLKRSPMFTMEEAQFIRDLIFFKPKDIVYFYLARHIEERTEVGRNGMFNSIAYRRYLFLKNFIALRGNVTKAAIASGYSPGSARQQGHRVLKEFQRYFRARDG